MGWWVVLVPHEELGETRKYKRGKCLSCPGASDVHNHPKS